MTKKIIAVVGATGAQGSGLVRAIHQDKDGDFRARAITRDVDSPKAKELAALGMEVVKADLDDESSLVRAFAGAHGAFCVTFYWDHFSPQREFDDAGRMARAAKHAGVNHVIWSTLEDTRRWLSLSDERMPTLAGRYKVPHWDCKGEADRLFTEIGVPTTNLLTSMFWENFIYFGAGPRRGLDGRLAITFPVDDCKLPGIAAEDIGKRAYGIFREGRRYVGATIGIAGEHLTGSEMAAEFTRALGREVVYKDVPPEVYRAFGFPGAEDIGNMFQFKRDFNEYFCNSRSVESSRSLNPELQDFGTWLSRNKSLIPIKD